MRKLCPKCETALQLNHVTYQGACCPQCKWEGEFRDGLDQPSIAAMKLPYVSIDLETTGLDDEFCQILEIGAVFDNWTKPVEELPTFHRIVTHETIIGQPYALSMHPHLLRLIAEQPLIEHCPTCGWNVQGSRDNGYCRACGWTGSRRDPVFCTINELADQFADWMFRECGWILSADNKITAAGKNFASFDLGFLKPCGFREFFKRRVLDPAPLFWQPEDDKLPDSKTCMERAGIDGKVAHTAVADAVAVVKMNRFAAKRILRNSENR